ncbi:MAG: hypothetical protein ACXV5H_10535 [Halobacteriota archaeon]
MQVVLSYTDKSDQCFYDLHSRCAKGLEEPDMTMCGECIADALQQIVDSRKTLSIFADSA